MPMYAYACKDCGHAFDIQQSFTEDSLTVCPECRGTLRKKFNSVGVVFKGSGFYRTDSRSTSSSVPAAATAGSTSGSSATSATAGSSSTGDSSTGTSSASKTPATANAGS
ncbi:zinc ribbon domain-containing protein [Arthrobacter alpinus]|uniref:FmdB family transcriptional regulator n=1 Tax=Arthrobacter alpinus TaxID=656366 RepID=A0A0S2LX69_9MICC|nr:FmdB family zinc ribbon protein [Arthrobacter alpinus]ALO66084.1 FmdB family transcriptional regulator [Arthrobacter alpinus]MDD0859089.1 zinc ribbon domain-containing protein [Arthrobacter alpinus]